MADPTPVAPQIDEVRLAQLACAKLAGIVQGTISVGLPGLVTGVPEPRNFFNTKLEVMAGYAQVLQSVLGSPAGQDGIVRLREQSRAVLTALESLRRNLFDYLGRPAEATSSFQAARASAEALCDALREYGMMVQVDGTWLLTVKQTVLQVFDGVADMITSRVKSAG